MRPAGKSIYLDLALKTAPRILSQIDRRIGSPTQGCFDREFWHHRSVDFPCMEKQESVLTLGLLHGLDHPGNPYYSRSALADWLRAGLLFWTESQRPNGSFDEWYPHENSTTATAFSTVCAAECLLREHKLDRQTVQTVVQTAERAAAWLIKQPEHQVCNQEAGSILAVYDAGLISRRQDLIQAARTKLEALLDLQTEEGWWPEYGGADIGYTSVALAYLAMLWQRLPDAGLFKALEKTICFLDRFVHLDGSPGGLYGSRQTEYILPAGPEILAAKSAAAARLSARLRSSLAARFDLQPNNLDHRYLLYHGYFFLLAFEAGPKEPLSIGSTADSDYTLPRAGLAYRRFGQAEAVISAKKGGLFKLAWPTGSLTDSGWTIVDGSGTWTSAHFRPEAEAEPIGDGFKYSGRLHKASIELMTGRRLVGLRIWQGLLGRFAGASLLLKRLARRILITGATAGSIKFERRIEIEGGVLVCHDLISGLDSGRWQLFLGGSQSFAYGPSSRTFRFDQLNSVPLPIRPEWVVDGRVEVVRRFTSDGSIAELLMNGRKMEAAGR